MVQSTMNHCNFWSYTLQYKKFVSFIAISAAAYRFDADVGAAAGDGRAGDGDEPGEEGKEADEKWHHELCFVFKHQFVAFFIVEDVVSLTSQSNGSGDYSLTNVLSRGLLCNIVVL